MVLCNMIPRLGWPRKCWVQHILYYHTQCTIGVVAWSFATASHVSASHTKAAKRLVLSLPTSENSKGNTGRIRKKNVDVIVC
jgi:hypothetical protein